jgi:hypothetical protein
VLKNTTPPTTDETSPGFEHVSTVVTPSIMMAAEDKVSSKPTLTKDKWNEFEEAKKAIKDDTPLGEGPLTKNWVAEGTGSIMLLGKSWGLKASRPLVGFSD